MKGKNKSLIILTILLSLYFVNLKYEIYIVPKISKIADENTTINTSTLNILNHSINIVILLSQ